jgi:hypothetical protein
MSHKVDADPWLPVCERCPLPDCVRHEGELGNFSRMNPWFKHNTLVRLGSCPITQALGRGWSAAEAQSQADELKLAPPIRLEV